MDKSVTLQKEVAPIVSKAQALVIKDEKTMEQSVELLSRCNIVLDKAKAEKEMITKPAREIIKRENERWAPVIDPAEEVVKIVRLKQSEYQTMLSREAKMREEKIIERVGEGRGKLKVETAIRKMEDIKKPDEKVVASSGSVKFRDHTVLKVVTLSDVPFEYFDLNEKKVIDALKAGIEVPGAVLEVIKIPINRR